MLVKTLSKQDRQIRLGVMISYDCINMKTLQAHTLLLNRQRIVQEFGSTHNSNKFTTKTMRHWQREKGEMLMYLCVRYNIRDVHTSDVSYRVSKYKQI